MESSNKVLRWYYILAVATLFALLGAGVGLKCDRYLLVKLGKGNVPVNAVVPNLPDARLEQAWVNLINNSKVSLVLAADRITSKTVLEAINRASNRGVEVVIVLSPDTNADPDRAARGWLTYKTTRPKLAVANQPFSGVWLLIDDRISVFSSVGVLNADDSSKANGFFFFIENPYLGSKTHENLLNLLQHSTIFRR